MRPPGANATEFTGSVWPVRDIPSGRGAVRSVTSHSRTVLSSPAVARVCPSGANATDRTMPVWPVNGAPSGRGAVRSVTSHSRTAPPLPALARVCPSGANATENAPPVWSVNGAPSCRGSGRTSAVGCDESPPWARVTARTVPATASSTAMAATGRRRRRSQVRTPLACRMGGPADGLPDGGRPALRVGNSLLSGGGVGIDGAWAA